MDLGNSSKKQVKQWEYASTSNTKFQDVSSIVTCNEKYTEDVKYFYS